MPKPNTQQAITQALRDMDDEQASIEAEIRAEDAREEALLKRTETENRRRDATDAFFDNDFGGAPVEEDPEPDHRGDGSFYDDEDWDRNADFWRKYDAEHAEDIAHVNLDGALDREHELGPQPLDPPHIEEFVTLTRDDAVEHALERLASAVGGDHRD